jgi:hypothetical protein
MTSAIQKDSQYSVAAFAASSEAGSSGEGGAASATEGSKVVTRIEDKRLVPAKV